MSNASCLIKMIKRMILLGMILCIVIAAGIIVLEYIVAGNTVITYKIEIWIEACQTVDFFLPLLVSVLFVPLVYIQKKDGFIKYATIRNRKFVIYEYVAIILSVFIIVFIAYYIPLIVSLKIITVQIVEGQSNLSEYVFGNWQIHHPYIFGIIWCVWKGIIAAIFTMAGCIIMLLIDNMFVATMFSFMYCMSENFITATLQIPKYSIMTSYVLNRLSPTCMHIWNYCVGMLVFILVCGIVIIACRIFNIKQVEGCEE
ncbi:MAG: hypothetical protein UH654_03385 [Lachnospiraceae bacterium]|nr:hypothetical protein [Lachnospiraceae bacterium]MEE0959063.1 hypothetical protein [Lachnospiraceae bacterium]